MVIIVCPRAAVVHGEGREPRSFFSRSRCESSGGLPNIFFVGSLETYTELHCYHVA